MVANQNKMAAFVPSLRIRRTRSYLISRLRLPGMDSAGIDRKRGGLQRSSCFKQRDALAPDLINLIANALPSLENAVHFGSPRWLTWRESNGTRFHLLNMFHGLWTAAHDDIPSSLLFILYKIFHLVEVA